jgi:soluble P-type ATPase
MISVAIPGFRSLDLRYLVCDYNGTLAVDGLLLPGVAEAMAELAGVLDIRVITADTFGLARAQLAGLPAALTITPVENQAEAKLAFVADLGPRNVVAVGNGRNDRKMLEAAALGIALIQPEGAAAEAIRTADVLCNSILDAFALLRNPKRLTATLRS